MTVSVDSKRAVDGEVLRRTTQAGESGDEDVAGEGIMDDSSGGETDVSPTPEERAEQALSEATRLLRNADSATAQDIRALRGRIFDLIRKGASGVSPVLRQELTRATRALLRVELRRDPDATQGELSELDESDGMETGGRDDEQVNDGTDQLGGGEPVSYGVRSQQPGDDEELEAGEYMVERLRGKRRVGKGKRRRTEYLVRWAAPYDDEQWDTWENEGNVYNQSLIDQYERRAAEDRVDDEDRFSDGGGGGGGGGDDDDDGDDGDGGGGGGSPDSDGDEDEDQEDADGFDVSKLLVYDANTSSIRTSLTLILQSVTAPTPDWLPDVLEELILTALWRLECVRVRASELPDAALNELLDEIETIDKDTLDAEFAALGRRPGSSRAADAQPISRADFDAAKRVDARQRIEQRARASRASTNAERQRLLDLLAAIDAIEAMTGGAPRPPDSGQPLTERVLNQYATPGAKWWLFFLRPKLRIHQQNQLIRYRAPSTQSWLDWLRGKQFPPAPRPSQRASDLLGSAYSGVIPQLVTSSTIPVEHAVPQSWYSRATQLQENGTPKEDACGVVLATKVENSQKSNKPVWFGSPNGGALTETPDHNLYRPMDAATFWTRARRAVVARCIVYSFLTYFITGQGSLDGWTAIDNSTGSQYYRSITELLLALAEEPVGALERLNARVLSDKVAPGWRNPLIFHATDLLGTTSTNPLAPRFRALLRKRLAGDTKVPVAVATALRGSILGLPTES